MKSTRLIPLAAAGALAASVLGSWTPAQADSSAGYVIGTVTDSTGRPLPGAGVTVFFCETVDPADGSVADADGCFDTDDEGYGYTDRNGRYVASVDNNDIAARAAGTGNWRVEAFKDDYTSPATSSATAIGARANNTAPTIVLTAETASPAPAGTVLSGVVTDAAGVPLADADVAAYDAAGDFVQSTSTGPDGRYDFAVADPAGADPATYPKNNVTGSVKLYASAPSRVGEWSGDTLAKSRATAVPVAAYGAAAATAPTMALATDGTVTGAVKLPAAGPNFVAYASLYDLDGTVVQDYIPTDSAGNFSTDVDPGSYLVRADGYRYTEESAGDPTCPACTESIESFGFVAGYYGGGTSLADAKPLKVGSAGSASAGTITLTNALRAVEKPTVKGKLKNGELKKNSKLKVSTGTWNRQSNVTYSYVWKVGSKTLSTTNKLKITKKVQKKIGKKLNKLTVTVTATDVYGELVDGSSKIKVKKALTKGDKDQDGKGKGKGGKGKGKK